MGKVRNAFEDFIYSIPDEKPSSFADTISKVYEDMDFRLDNQGV